MSKRWYISTLKLLISCLLLCNTTISSLTYIYSIVSLPMLNHSFLSLLSLSGFLTQHCSAAVIIIFILTSTIAWNKHLYRGCRWMFQFFFCSFFVWINQKHQTAEGTTDWCPFFGWFVIIRDNQNPRINLIVDCSMWRGCWRRWHCHANGHNNYSLSAFLAHPK